jgi:manganese efflux pump family protein
LEHSCRWSRRERHHAAKPITEVVDFRRIGALASSGLSFLSILILSLGLAMDAMAVSAAKAIAVPKILPRHVVLVAAFFGGFQALMPLLGWAIGASLGRFVDAWAHWIAFGLLGAIGAKMVWEARGHEEADSEKDRGADPFALRIMLLLAVATSIDALAVGVSLPMLKAPIVLTLATIGVTTAALSALGLYAGRRFGALLGKRLDLVGGLVLIGLGTKILVEHFRSK